MYCQSKMKTFPWAGSFSKGTTSYIWQQLTRKKWIHIHFAEDILFMDDELNINEWNQNKSNYICSFDSLILHTGCNDFKFTCEPFCSCSTFSRSSRGSVCSRWESEVMAGRRKSQSGRVCTCRYMRKALKPLYPLSYFNSLSLIKQEGWIPLSISLL